MNINLTISEAPGITTDYLISAIYEANPDGTIGPLVTSQAFAAPHTSPQNVTFVDLDVAVYVHILWQNSTSSPGGTNRGKFIYDPQYNNSTLNVREDLVLVVGAGGDNPVNGERVFTLASLNGWEYSIERRGGGTLIPGTEVNVSADGETITLLAPVDPFLTDEVIVLHFIPQIVTNNPIAVTNSGKVFSNSDIITADEALGATDIGKVKVLQGASDTLNVTLPPLADVAVNRMICIISEGGSHINATILCDGSDTINFNGIVDHIILGQSDRLWIYKSLDQNSLPIWEIAVDPASVKVRGEIFQSYKTTEKNALFCDGTEHDRAQYPGLWEYIQTIDPSAIVNDADWSNVALNNKAKFSTGDGSTTFRLPQLFTPGFLRAVDGTRKSGSYESQQMLDHQHETPIYSDGSSLFGQGVIARLGGTFFGILSGVTALTSKPRKSDGSDETQVGTETRPANSGIYLLIRS